MVRGKNSETHAAIAESLRQLDDLRGDLDKALCRGNRGMAACLLTQIQRTAAILDDLDDARPPRERAASHSTRIVKLDAWMSR